MAKKIKNLDNAIFKIFNYFYQFFNQKFICGLYMKKSSEFYIFNISEILLYNNNYLYMKIKKILRLPKNVKIHFFNNIIFSNIYFFVYLKKLIKFYLEKVEARDNTILDYHLIKNYKMVVVYNG